MPLAKCKLVVTLALACVVTSTVFPPAHAQARAGSIENAFFEFFNKTCILNMPRLDKVRAAAKFT